MEIIQNGTKQQHKNKTLDKQMIDLRTSSKRKWKRIEVCHIGP